MDPPPAPRPAGSPPARYSQRPRKPISYVELEEPDFDEFIWCDDCSDFVYEYCAIHGPLAVLPDDKVPSDLTNFNLTMADLSIPSYFLHVAPSTIPGAGLGVFTTLPMPKGVRFGPYKGVIQPLSNDSRYSWQIHETSRSKAHMINADDPRRSNWMRYVNCSRFWREQNLVPFQYQGNLYYRTIKNIPRNRELLVFYGKEYAALLGIDMLYYNAPRSRLIGIYEYRKSFQNAVLSASTAPPPPPVYSSSSSLIGESSESAPKGPDNDTKPENKPETQETEDFNRNIAKNSIHVKKHVCSFFRPEFKDEAILKAHIKEHALVCPFVCTRCYKCFDTEVKLHLHFKQHDEEKFQCDLCHKIFVFKSALITHFNGLCTKINIKATVEFEKSECQNKHSRINSNEKPYKCTICPYSCSTSGHLQTHLRIHSGEKLYKCTICPYSCTQNVNLQTHLRIHSGEKPYKCTICPYSCSTNGSLQRHLRIHSGEKPYKCTICPYSCTQNVNLQRHLRIHSGEKPYKCTICPYSCTQNVNLQRHLRIHSGEKPYKCTICPYSCTNNSNLKKHLKVH